MVLLCDKNLFLPAIIVCYVISKAIITAQGRRWQCRFSPINGMHTSTNTITARASPSSTPQLSRQFSEMPTALTQLKRNCDGRCQPQKRIIMSQRTYLLQRIFGKMRSKSMSCAVGKSAYPHGEVTISSRLQLQLLGKILHFLKRHFFFHMHKVV